MKRVLPPLALPFFMWAAIMMFTDGKDAGRARCLFLLDGNAACQ